MLSHVITNIFFRYSRPNGEQIDEFEVEDDTHQTIGRCRCLENHTPTEEAIATSGHLGLIFLENLLTHQVISLFRLLYLKSHL